MQYRIISKGVKLGCIFTQTDRDEEERPIRDESSTSYTGAIETAETFGWRIYKEAKRRGMDRAGAVVVMSNRWEDFWEQRACA